MSTNLKILLIILAKYAISGHSDMETDLLPDLYGFVWIQCEINHFCFSEKYAHLIHRQGATDYKVHGSDFRGESVTIALSRLKRLVAKVFISSRFRPSLTGLAWLRCL